MQQRFGVQGRTMDWQAAPGSPSTYIVKKVLRLEIPVDSYPNVSYAPSISSYYALMKYDCYAFSLYHNVISLTMFLLNISSILLGGF